jgi:hypothetical protein
MKINKIILTLISTVFMVSCYQGTESETLSQIPRRVGDRPIIVSDLIVTNKIQVNEIEANNFSANGSLIVSGIVSIISNPLDFVFKFGESDTGFKDIDGDIGYYINGKQIFNLKESGIELVANNENIASISFIGSQAENSKSTLRDNLGLGSISTYSTNDFLQVNNPKFIQRIEGTNNSSIVLLPENAEQYELVGLFNQIERNLDIPGLVVSKGEYSWSALTVDIDNDPYPNSNSEIFNSLARVLNTNGDKAIIWDSANDGSGSGLDTDLARGSIPVRILEQAPNSITDAGQEGELAIKQHNGNNYLIIFRNNEWSWIQMNKTAFPWQ